MDRSPARWISSPPLLALAMLLATSGCAGMLLTPLYLIKGNDVPPDYDGLEGKRVVVICRPPTTLEYSYGGVDREISKRIGLLLAENVKKIDVVKPQDVEAWLDERDFRGPAELAKALDAELVVQIDLEDFSLRKGPTLLQGRADVLVTVFDAGKDSDIVFEKALGEILYPVNGGVPAQEKQERQFRRQYVSMLAARIAKLFYPHDPHADFALDSTAHR